MEEQTVQPMEGQTVQRIEKRRWMPGWAKILIAVVLTLALSTAGWCLLLGQNGLALVEGWLLARFAFVDTQADLDGAVDQALSGLVSGLGTAGPTTWMRRVTSRPRSAGRTTM